MKIDFIVVVFIWIFHCLANTMRSCSFQLVDNLFDSWFHDWTTSTSSQKILPFNYLHLGHIFLNQRYCDNVTNSIIAKKKTNKVGDHNSSYKTRNRMKYWMSTISDGIMVYWKVNSLDTIQVMKLHLLVLKMWLLTVMCVLHNLTLLSWRQQQDYYFNGSLFSLFATWTCYLIIVIGFIIW